MKRLFMITMFTAVIATILFSVSGRTSTNPSPGPDMIPGAPKTYQVTGPVLLITDVLGELGGHRSLQQLLGKLLQ